MYGSPLTSHARKIMLLGSGELGKEVILEAQRLGVETIAVDRYANAPAMQVAHRSYVIDMLDAPRFEKLFCRRSLIFSCLRLKPLLQMRLLSSSRKASGSFRLQGQQG